MPCCSMYFGTESTQADCLLPAAINRNSAAFYYFPYTVAPNPNRGRVIYLRLFSHAAIQNVIMRIYVGGPLVNGQFTSDPAQYCEYPLAGNWVAGSGYVYQNS